MWLHVSSVFPVVHYSCEWCYIYVNSCWVVRWLLVWISTGAEESAGDLYSVCVFACVFMRGGIRQTLFKRSNTKADVVDPVLYYEANKDVASDNPLPLCLVRISQMLGPQWIVLYYLWFRLWEIYFHLYCAILVYHHLFKDKASKCKVEFDAN